MEANLVMQIKKRPPKAIPVPNEVTVIGRQRNCDLRIPLESISRRHCQVHRDNEGVLLRDLGSRNGTFLNGAKVSHEEQMLHPGDRIQIGPITFVLQINGQPDVASLNTKAQPSKQSASDTSLVIEKDGLEDNQPEDGLGDSDNLDDLGLDDLDDDLSDLDDLDDLDLDDL